MSDVVGSEGWRPTKVHPLAELFPPLSDDAFDELVDDIAENGQFHAILVSSDGTLVDGRMRLAATDKAGVEPVFEVLPDDVDIEALIWSVNGKRRQTNKGQLAMIAAQNLFAKLQNGSDAEQKACVLAAKGSGVTGERLSRALTVARYTPTVVQSIIDGGMKLEAAYEKAKEIKDRSEVRDLGLVELRKQDRDLAQRVVDREIGIAEARKIIEDRKAATREARDSALLGLASVLRGADGFDRSDALLALPAQLATPDGYSHLQQYFRDGVEELAERYERARAGFDKVGQVIDQIVNARGGKDGKKAKRTA